MNYLFLLLGFCSFVLCSFFIEKFLPLYLRRYAFICAISLMSIFLYLFTFIGNFFYIQYIFYFFALGILINELVVHKFRQLKIFCSLHRIVLIFSLAWFLLTIKAQILQWDDFSWGSFVKHLNLYGAYWTSRAAILPAGLRYFPGISLWENFFLGHNHYFEQPIFFALGLICIASFYALRSPEASAKQTFYQFILFCAPVSWFTIGMGTIGTEVPLGFLLGIGIVSSFDIKKSSDLFVPFIIALFLAITKETGLLLALLIILLVVIRSIREKNFFSTWTLFSLTALLFIFFNYQLWQWHIGTDPQITPFNSGNISNAIQSDFTQLSTRSSETLSIFFKALYNKPIARSFLSRIPMPYFNYIKGFYIFWVLVIASVLFQIRKKYEYIITFFWGLIGYTSVLVVTFLYFFGEYEGKNLASYERYIGVYFLAFSLVGIKIIFEEKLFLNKFFFKCLMILILIFPPSPSVIHPPSVLKLIPQSLARKFKLKMDTTRENVEQIRSKIELLTPIDSKVWFIWQNSQGREAMIVRYKIAPRKMNIGGWSVGEKYYDGDVWTSNTTPQDLAETFATVDYIALGFIDDRFLKKYGELFSTPPRSGALYKKETINNTIRLMEI